MFKSMILNYKKRIIKAISLATNLDQLDYIKEKLYNTEEINRRTKQGRELTSELLILINQKAQELIDKGAVPF